MDDLDELIASLDGDDSEEAENAQYSLIALSKNGTAVLPALIGAARQFERFGLLCAIDVIDGIAEIGERGELNNPSESGVGPLLSWMLANEHDTVREWAARTAGTLGVTETIPALQAAWQQSKINGIAADWSEPMAYRNALADLGARRRITPHSVAQRQLKMPPFDACWRSDDVLEALKGLNRADQIITLVQYWMRDEGKFYGIDNNDWPNNLDSIENWSAIIVQQATIIDQLPVPPTGSYATLDWVDKSDR